MTLTDLQPTSDPILHPILAGRASYVGEGFHYLGALTECMDAGVLIVDAEREVVLCNTSLAALFGLTVEEVTRLGLEPFMEHVCQSVVNPPLVVRERKLIGDSGQVVCEEFEIREPRSVVRWVARSFNVPQGTQIVVCTDITTEIDFAEAYQQLALTDSLTGLVNRRGIDQHLQREAARARRHGHQLSFGLLDVDYFKRVNDRFGHGAGDDVLRRVARSLAALLRAGDVAARWGGEEFLVMLVDTGIDGARRCAERLRGAVESLTIPDVGQVTVSVGVAELAPNEDLSRALLRADELLYRAKAEGRNCVRG